MAYQACFAQRHLVKGAFSNGALGVLRNLVRPASSQCDEGEKPARAEVSRPDGQNLSCRALGSVQMAGQQMLLSVGECVIE